MGLIAWPKMPSFFRATQKLSAKVLSQQLPLRLMLCFAFYKATHFTNASL
jgi:hypothetical protein